MPTENADARALLKRAKAQDDPVKKHALLTQAEALAPDSLEIAEELLFLGRLYERDARKLDYSVIKCYLLNLYLNPRDYAPDQAESVRAELFGHSRLLRCQALSDDPDAYLRKYLTRLSTEFIDLFLHGSSRYMRRFFGFTSENNAPKYLAVPACDMLAAMRADPALSPERKALLTRCFYGAFATYVSGKTDALDQRLADAGLSIEE